LEVGVPLWNIEVSMELLFDKSFLPPAWIAPSLRLMSLKTENGYESSTSIGHTPE
jgi:hypothetical protein